jgi:hypothetical protein
MADPSYAIPGDLLLKRCPQTQAGLSFPIPINQRIDLLCDLADEEGIETSRKDLVAALVLAAEPNPRKLAAAIQRYRKARAREAAVGPGDEENVLRLQVRKPGPKNRKVAE